LSLPTDLPLDAQAGRRRLLAHIDAFGHEATPSGVQAGRGWLKQGLRAAAVVQVLGLSIVGYRLWLPDPTALYRTLSREAAPAVAGTIRVVPDAAMALADWNALLHVLRLRVVGGPDAAGAYTVAPMDPRATTRHTLQQLRSAQGIRLAEAVTAAR